jgi:hypothetical protein
VEVLELIMSERTPPPQIVPTSAGQIQVEWHEGGLDLEIEITGRYQVQVFLEDAPSGECWEKEMKMNLVDLDNAVRLLEQRVEAERIGAPIPAPDA